VLLLTRGFAANGERFSKKIEHRRLILTASGDSTAEHAAQLSTIKPQTVLHAAVNLDPSTVGLGGIEDLHLVRAAGATTIAGTASRLEQRSRRDQHPAALTQEFKFTLVEPDSAAFGAPVDLDLVALDDDEYGATGWTAQCFLPSIKCRAFGRLYPRYPAFIRRHHGSSNGFEPLGILGGSSQ